MSQKLTVRIISHEGWQSVSASGRPAIAWYFAWAIVHFGWSASQGNELPLALPVSPILGFFAVVGYFSVIEMTRWRDDISGFALHWRVLAVTFLLEILCLFVIPFAFALMLGRLT